MLSFWFLSCRISSIHYKGCFVSWFLAWVFCILHPGLCVWLDTRLLLLCFLVTGNLGHVWFLCRHRNNSSSSSSSSSWEVCDRVWWWWWWYLSAVMAGGDMTSNGNNLPIEKLEIRVQEPELVHPAEPVEHQVYYLSNLDQNIAVPMKTVWFFNGQEDKKDQDPAAVLKEALRKLLVHMFFLAGRIGLSPDYRLQIEFEDQGLVFVEAVAEKHCIAEFGDVSRPAPFMKQLVYEPPPSENILGSPPTFVQVRYPPLHAAANDFVRRVKTGGWRTSQICVFLFVCCRTDAATFVSWRGCHEFLLGPCRWPSSSAVGLHWVWTITTVHWMG